MSDINAPLLSRRRLEDGVQQPSSHNLLDRNRNNSSDEDQDEEESLPTDYGSGVYRYPAYLQPGHFTSLEKLFFFTSSILLILLFIFVGLYARSSQQENHPVLPPAVPEIPKNNTKKQISCLEPNCIITAAQILQDVDQELNPCDDFYAYTCDKWKSSHLIPDVKSRIDVPSLMTESIRHRLHQILSRDFDSLINTLGSSLPDPNTILDRQLFTKMQDLYTSCMNQDMIEQRSITPLYPIFRSIRQFIPLSNNQVTHSGLNDAAQYLADRNIWPLFQLKVEPDMILNPNKPSLSLGQGHVNLPNRAAYDDPEILQVYTQVVTSILDIIFKKDTEFGWKSWSTIATARRIVEFEKKVAQATSGQQPERWTIEKLKSRVPQINWTQLFIPTLPVPPTHILIPHANFIDNLNNDVLSDTNSRTLQMYFIWRSLWTYIDVLGEEFAAPKRKLEAKLSGIEPRATPERWETCIDVMDKSAMGVLLGRYFVTDHQHHMAQIKQKVEELARAVVDIMIRRVPQLPWIKDDYNTQNEILKKLDSMEFQVGFSTSKPDIRSVISLSEYFGDVTMDKQDFFENMMKSNQHQVKQEVWGVLQDPFIDKNAWKVNAQSVQVSYNKELNKVMIPGGLLQLPFIDINGPAYLYYGTIGWMIGHEMMHGFDSLGRKYNSQGNFGSWWKDETVMNLDSQNQCLVSQYNGFGLDGERTLNNNFADLGGLLVLEQLLNKTKSNISIIIPGLNAWTQDQLTFIQFARMKCSKSTKEHKKLIKGYSPDRYRVNGPLINSNHFSATFGCKVGSLMNPAIKKCQVW